MADLRIVAITPARLDDLDTLFTRGDPRTCQCAFLRLTASDYRAAGPVGWVSTGPRSEYARLVASPVLHLDDLDDPDDAEPTAVVCFVIAPRARRRGVARALLDAVIDDAAERGIGRLEAYPVDYGDERQPGAELWRGPLRLYEAAGFTVAATRRANATAHPQLVMRRTVPSPPTG